MATSKLFAHLRRRSLSSSSFTLFRPIQSRHLTDPTSPSPPPPTPSHRVHFPSPTLNSLACFHFFSSRSFSTRSSNRDSEYGEFGLDADSVAESELLNQCFNGVESDVVDGVVGSGAESILPVRGLISLLDGYHDFTGFPWWIIIASSTLALRITLFPILILQLNKLKRIAELFPKLPPPLPPPLSGRSFIDQISLFRKERRANGCPSYLWFLAFFSIQQAPSTHFSPSPSPSPSPSARRNSTSTGQISAIFLGSPQLAHSTHFSLSLPLPLQRTPTELPTAAKITPELHAN